MPRLVRLASALAALVTVLGGCRDASLGGDPPHDAALASTLDAGPSLATDSSATRDAAAPDDPFHGIVAFDDDATRAVDSSTLASASSPCRAPVLVRVVSVTDGDTFTAQSLDGATTERVRIIGVNAPEVSHREGEPSDCYGPEASAFTSALRGRLVWLTFDQLCQDPYDRTLAYVHLGPLPHQMWERQLLRRGLARVYIIGRNRALEPVLTADATAAQGEGRGLWSACAAAPP